MSDIGEKLEDRCADVKGPARCQLHHLTKGWGQLETEGDPKDPSSIRRTSMGRIQTWRRESKGVYALDPMNGTRGSR